MHRPSYRRLKLENAVLNYAIEIEAIGLMICRVRESPGYSQLNMVNTLGIPLLYVTHHHIRLTHWPGSIIWRTFRVSTYSYALKTYINIMTSKVGSHMQVSYCIMMASSAIMHIHALTVCETFHNELGPDNQH